MEEITSIVDEIYSLAKKKGQVTLEQLAEHTGVSEEKIEEWCTILDKEGLIELVYPTNPLAPPFIQIPKEGKKEGTKPSKLRKIVSKKQPSLKSMIRQQEIVIKKLEKDVAELFLKKQDIRKKIQEHERRIVEEGEKAKKQGEKAESLKQGLEKARKKLRKIEEEKKKIESKISKTEAKIKDYEMKMDKYKGTKREKKYRELIKKMNKEKKKIGKQLENKNKERATALKEVKGIEEKIEEFFIAKRQAFEKKQNMIDAKKKAEDELSKISSRMKGIEEQIKKHYEKKDELVVKLRNRRTKQAIIFLLIVDAVLISVLLLGVF